MRKSLFRKYLLLISVIVFGSFIIMGAIFFVSMSNYWVGDKLDNLKENVETIAAYVGNKTVKTADNSYELPVEAQTFAVAFSQSAQADVFIAGKDGTIIFCSEQTNCNHIGKKVPEVTMAVAMKGAYNGVGKLGGLYSEEHYVVGTPLYFLEDTGENKVIGAAFIASSARSFTMFKQDMIRIFIFAAIFATLISFAAASIMSYRMVLPLREMSAAAANFGKGDFSRRVRVVRDDEVGELAVAFNNMASSLASGESMRRSFIANVSHELKTPMTTIAGFIDGILDGTIPEEKRDRYLKIVSDEIKRLSRLVKTMLDLSRIDSGKLKVTPVNFDLTEVIGTVLLSFEQRIEVKDIRITGLEDCPRMNVTADYDLIGQVCYNLLDNAVKFTNEGGEIRVELRRDEGRTYCTVHNTGVGIPAEEMPHVFERFYKSDKSRSLDKNGVGLGLYIVKTVIGLHHGEIVVRSVAGEYCEFSFWLPDPPSEEKKPEGRKSEGKKSDARKGEGRKVTEKNPDDSLSSHNK